MYSCIPFAGTVIIIQSFYSLELISYNVIHMFTVFGANCWRILLHSNLNVIEMLLNTICNKYLTILYFTLSVTRFLVLESCWFLLWTLPHGLLYILGRPCIHFTAGLHVTNHWLAYCLRSPTKCARQCHLNDLIQYLKLHLIFILKVSPRTLEQMPSLA